MMTKRINQKDSAEKTVRDIRRATRRRTIETNQLTLIGFFLLLGIQTLCAQIVPHAVPTCSFKLIHHHISF